MTKPAGIFQGKTAVVTGSSSGIGRAIALRLAGEGATVLVHARKNRRGADATAEEIRKLGRESEVVLADLSEAKEQDQLVESAFEWRKKIDVWINNAGADVLTGDDSELSFEEKLARLWTVDVTATMRVSRAVGARMKAAGRGVILNMGWDQAERGMAGDSGELFAASKGAVMAFSKSLSRSLAPEVRVNCIAPGWIRTAWGETASEYWQKRAKHEALLGRWGEPEDVAATASFLASDAAAFITGQVVAVNGGMR